MIRSLSRFFFLCVFVIVVTSSWTAQSAPRANGKVDGRYLDALARAAMRQDRIPGAAIAVVQDGAVVHLNAYGTANHETLEAMAPETLCRIGSTSKVFTALLFAILIDRGKIRLEARIGESVKGLPPRLAGLTGRQLLTHTGGLQERGEILDYWGRSDDGSLAAKVSSFGDDLFFTEPGRLFSYSNLHYVLAGRWCEVVGHKPFGRMVKEHIFDPVGMASSTLRLSEAMTRSISQGHVPADHPFARVDRYRAFHRA